VNLSTRSQCDTKHVSVGLSLSIDVVRWYKLAVDDCFIRFATVLKVT